MVEVEIRIFLSSVKYYQTTILRRLIEFAHIKLFHNGEGSLTEKREETKKISAKYTLFLQHLINVI